MHMANTHVPDSNSEAHVAVAVVVADAASVRVY